VKNETKLKLGDCVTCSAYLKKVKTKHVFADKEAAKGVDEDYVLALGDYDDILHQVTRKLSQSKFNGIVVGYKNVATKNKYQHPERAIYDPVSLGFVDAEIIEDQVMVSKTCYVRCALVFYALGKSRLVPIEHVELLEESK
jgi:hypothetical protein